MLEEVYPSLERLAGQVMDALSGNYKRQHTNKDGHR
jgi:hypothetical protein